MTDIARTFGVSRTTSHCPRIFGLAVIPWLRLNKVISRRTADALSEPTYASDRIGLRRTIFKMERSFKERSMHEEYHYLLRRYGE